MSCILHIETSTSVCSVALSQDGACIYHEENFDGPSHAALLAPYVAEALSFADSHAIPLDAVAVSADGRGVPLIAVSTLELLCVPTLLYGEELPDDALLCPMVDARRMEVYDAVFDRALRAVRPVGAEIVGPDSFADLLAVRPMYFMGNGAAKCKAVLTHPNAHFIDGVHPLARHMFPLAERAVAQGRFEDVAYFEPFYLKQFVTSKPKDLLHGL